MSESPAEIENESRDDAEEDSSSSSSDSDDDFSIDDADDDSKIESGDIDWFAEEELQFEHSNEDIVLKTKHEVDEEIVLPDIEQINISKEHLVMVGTVMSKIDSETTIVIKSIETSSPVNEGSVLCLQNGFVIGKVQEVFGPLNLPFYIVKWSNSIPNADKTKITIVATLSSIEVGVEIYCVERYD